MLEWVFTLVWNTQIAVDALLVIAAHTNKGYAIAVPIISKRLVVSHSYLELIFSSLKTAGLVHSHRGPGGGYSLAKEPGAISVRDIVDATGESPSLGGGPSTQLWVNLDAHMQTQMAQITLSQLLAQTTIQIDPSLERLGLKLKKVQKTKAPTATTETKPTKVRKSLGPNSVFSFGKYLLHKK